MVSPTAPGVPGTPSPVVAADGPLMSWSARMDSVTLRACTGSAFSLRAGTAIRISNNSGAQVVDCWAVNPADPDECLSMEHTRTSLSRITPRRGDDLFSNRRRPLLTVIEDTSPGTHDTLIAACDLERYRQLGVDGYHPSCAENYHAALATAGVRPSEVPSPLNLFMHVLWDADGQLRFLPTASRPGDYITLRARIDVLMVLSACPMDINQPRFAGHQPRPSDVDVHVIPAD
jgi:uncharacterized protein